MSWDLYWCHNNHWIVIQRKDEKWPIPSVITCPWCCDKAQHIKVVEKLYIDKEAQE